MLAIVDPTAAAVHCSVLRDRSEAVLARGKNRTFADGCIRTRRFVSLQVPKVEALTILSSLVCFPNHFEQLDVLVAKDKEYAPATMERTALKRMIMRDLVRASQHDPMLESRSVAAASASRQCSLPLQGDRSVRLGHLPLRGTETPTIRIADQAFHHVYGRMSAGE